MSKKQNFKNSLKYSLPEQVDLNNQFMSLIDEYIQNNTLENREFLCYLTSAIFLTYRKLYPQLDIYMPFRIKSDVSFMKNSKKEFEKFIKNFGEKSSKFDTFPIAKDISGIRIVLDNINRSVSGENDLNLFSDPEIIFLLEEADNNFVFINQLYSYLKSPVLSGEKYYNFKTELLSKIVSITPEEFTKEVNGTKSYRKLLDEAKVEFKALKDNESIPTSVSIYERADLERLLRIFRFRIEDKLQFTILRKTLPVVFEEPLIKNALKTSFEFNKELKKENGFQGIYYNLKTPFGPIELQAHSNKAYEEQLKGSAYHSGMIGKQVQIKDFFELVDPNSTESLEYYIDTLDNISADSLISECELPTFKTDEEKAEFLKTPLGQHFKESEYYRDIMNNKIKIKDKIVLSNNYIVNTDEHLLSIAMSMSPYMNTCSSGHTSFTTASIHHKKVIGEFSEILRKRDSNTCLREMIIRRLEKIINQNMKKAPSELSPTMRSLMDSIRYHDEVAEKLPRDISKKSIINYAEKLKIIELNKSGFSPEKDGPAL